LKTVGDPIGQCDLVAPDRGDSKGDRGGRPKLANDICWMKWEGGKEETPQKRSVGKDRDSF